MIHTSDLRLRHVSAQSAWALRPQRWNSLMILLLAAVGYVSAAMGAVEDKQSQLISKALGSNKTGYFLVVQWDMNSELGKPVDLKPTAHLYDGRDSAKSALEEHVKNDQQKHGFRVVKRFEKSPVSKEFAEQFVKQFQNGFERLRLPVPEGKRDMLSHIHPEDGYVVFAMTADAKSVSFTVTETHPKIKQPLKLTVTMP